MSSESYTRVERFLRLFTDVRPGEGATALLMFANVFLILCSYYFIKPLRDGWIAISDIAGLSKMEVKAYTSFGQGLLLVPIVAFYAKLATRLRASEPFSYQPVRPVPAGVYGTGVIRRKMPAVE